MVGVHTKVSDPCWSYIYNCINCALLIVLLRYTGIPNAIMSENVHVSDSSSEHDWPRARLPLNSKRLTAEQVKRVGKALGAPTEASVDEVRVMIEGKLREMDRDPANVQVVVASTGLSLCGEDGEFLSITEPPSPEITNDPGGEEQGSSDERSEANSGEQEVEQLRTELQEAKIEYDCLPP